MSIKESTNLQLVEIWGKSWKLNRIDDISFFSLEHEFHPDIKLYRNIIPSIINDLASIEGVRVPQQIAFCPPKFYWQRFLEKAKRNNFDPQPWAWSEGDVETTHLGEIFCIKLGAEFSSDSERRRFVAHESDHPVIINKNACIHGLLADWEGIVEADARIALGIQLLPDMNESTRFITGLPADKLVPAVELNRLRFNHPAFYGKKPSESEGYTSAMLWFLGISFETAKQPNAPLKDQYLVGRKKLMEIASNCQSGSEYISQLAASGIQYNSLAQNTEILISTQSKLSLFLTS